MNINTVFFVYNENGLISISDLEDFCFKFIKTTSLQFRVFMKEEIDPLSTIYKKFSSSNLEFIIYDYGYVLKIEGNIKESIVLLRELDEVLDNSIIFYISPSQRIENCKELEFPRGSSLKQAAQFLDKVFCNNDYTSVIKQE